MIPQTIHIGLIGLEMKFGNNCCIIGKMTRLFKNALRQTKLTENQAKGAICILRDLSASSAMLNNCISSCPLRSIWYTVYDVTVLLMWCLSLPCSNSRGLLGAFVFWNGYLYTLDLVIKKNGTNVDISDIHKETHTRKSTGAYVDQRSETTQVNL
ncbi:hypothetical protein A2U01_0017130 [Trifolium medium]|uniref:Uncharacterized protein n=1 Tax=Trifolium medium TaxID=97028 RepID=A0A392N8L9_9FABA|nr:hypothetical protein [Trifolium medium]